MQLFYSQNILSTTVLLEEDEAHHCTHVLRAKIGDHLSVTDGKGNLYHTSLDFMSKKDCRLTINEHFFHAPPPANLHLAVAPTKNMDRLEWLIEKAVEMGVQTFTPILTDRSERRQLRIDRLEKISLAAMKQSLRYYLPKINEPIPFSKWLSSPTLSEARFIAHCNDTPKIKLQTAPLDSPNICLLIGPEGDFTPAEVLAAEKIGYQAVSLGNMRLRTETAALAGVWSILSRFE